MKNLTTEQKMEIVKEENELLQKLFALYLDLENGEVTFERHQKIGLEVMEFYDKYEGLRESFEKNAKLLQKIAKSQKA